MNLSCNVSFILWIKMQTLEASIIYPCAESKKQSKLGGIFSPPKTNMHMVEDSLKELRGPRELMGQPGLYLKGILVARPSMRAQVPSVNREKAPLEILQRKQRRGTER